MSKRKSIGFGMQFKAADGSVTYSASDGKFELAVDEAHTLGARMAPSKRSWRQPEVFVYEQFSDESSELVYYEYFIKDQDARSQHRA